MTVVKGDFYKQLNLADRSASKLSTIVVMSIVYHNT